MFTARSPQFIETNRNADAGRITTPDPGQSSSVVMRRLSAIMAASGLALAACGGRNSADSREAASRNRDGGQTVLVFAAANMRLALSDMAQHFRVKGGDSIIVVFGSTSALTTQIINGAPADIFFAANSEAIDSLAVRNMIVDSTRLVYALGRLALVARCPATSPLPIPCPAPGGLEDLTAASLRSIAIADPQHAPYGHAAKQALERAGLWQKLKSRAVFGANVSQALQFVTTGNADVGIVALSLVARDSIHAYTLVDESLHDPLQQTLAVLAGSRNQVAAHRFLAFLNSTEGREIMHGSGFTVVMPTTDFP